MALDRWDPFREMMTLREAMDRLFQESVVRPTGSFLAGARGATPVDIAENDNGFVIHASMPGIRPEDVQITIKGDSLTIRGEKKAEEERKDENWLVRERRSASFYRTVTLPAQVDADKAEAKFENGVLTLTLPKAEEARPKQIRVGSQTSQPSIQTPGRTDQSVAGSESSGGQVSGSQASGSQASGGQPGQTSTAGSTGAEATPDHITSASEESFPASDPPSWTPERS